MLRLGLGLGVTVASLLNSTALTPSVPPFTNFVLEGDSLTGSGNLGQNNGSWAWQYLLLKPNGTTGSVRAQGSRYTGDLSMLGNQSNTLFGHLPEDLDTYGGGLIWAAPFLTNDFGSGFHGNTPGAPRAAQIMQRLAEYKNLVNQAGGKFAFGFGPPLRFDNPASSPDSEWSMTRNAFMANFRDPAVWSTVCDYYVPVGEQPDFNAADNSAVIGTDLVHPTEFGQTKLLSVNQPTLNTLLDPARVNATTMHGSAWPSGAANLSVGGKSVYSFVVSGLGHKGIAIGGQSPYQLAAGSNSRVRLNNGAFGSSVTGWLYNGDTVFQEVTHSASPNTDFTRSLTVGSETRQILFKTASGGNVGYTAGGSDAMLTGDLPSATHVYPAKVFASAGLATVALHYGQNGGASGVAIGSVQATLLGQQVGPYGGPPVQIWGAQISSGGAKDIVITGAGAAYQSAITWLVVTGADPVPVQVLGANDNGPDPHSTGEATTPSGGLVIGAFGQTDRSATTTVGTQIGDALSPDRQGGKVGVNTAARTTTGELSWTIGYGAYARVAVVFQPA